MTETDGMRPDVTGVAAVINIFTFPCDQSYKRSTIVLYNTMVEYEQLSHQQSHNLRALLSIVKIGHSYQSKVITLKQCIVTGCRTSRDEVEPIRVDYFGATLV